MSYNLPPGAPSTLYPSAPPMAYSDPTASLGAIPSMPPYGGSMPSASPYGMGSDLPPDLTGGYSGMTSYGGGGNLGLPSGYGGAAPLPSAGMSGMGLSPPTPSSAFSDPYAPGGAFSVGPQPSGAIGLPPSRLPLLRPGHFGPPPKGLPRWLIIGGSIVVVVVLLMFLGQMMKSSASGSGPTAPAPTSPPPVVPACPPVGPARPEEIILRIPKDIEPLQVQVKADVSGVIRTKEEGREEREGDGRREEPRHDARAAPETLAGGAPPIVIVNDTRTPQPAPPLDLWELAFAGDSMNPLSPRGGDTNMVFTRVGAAF